MTTPDSRPIHDVIAEAVASVLDVYDTVMNVRAESRDVAAAVVAACQQATVEQQAELLGEGVGQHAERSGAEIDTAHLSVLGADGEYHRGPYQRVIGPWREDPS